MEFPNKHGKINYLKQNEEVLKHFNWNYITAELVYKITFNVVYPKDVDKWTTNNYTTGSHFLTLWNIIQKYKVYKK